MKTRIADVLRHKGQKLVTTRPTTSVYDTIAAMVEHNVGAMLITEGNTLCGIFTERDYLRRIVLQGRTSMATQVGEVMTENVVFVDPGYTITECLAVMTQKKCRHLPVIQDNQLVGIVSIGDCVKELSANAQARVHYLTEYITGQYPA